MLHRLPLSRKVTSAATLVKTCSVNVRSYNQMPPPRSDMASRPAVMSADEAVKVVKSGDTVFVHTAAATPDVLLRALSLRAPELKDVTMCHLHIEGAAPHAKPEFKDSFRDNNFFVGKNMRAAVNEGRADFVPIFLSEVPYLFLRKQIPLDVAMLSVSPPDRHGYCSFGTSIDCSVAAAATAKNVIAVVNKHVPRTFGAGIVHISQFDKVVYHDEPLPEHGNKEDRGVMESIGKHIADLVEDGSTLQMGIGGIPDATLRYLTDRKDLGVHTEMFSEGVVDLVRRGVINNRMKNIMPGKMVASFLIGSQELYDFVDDNPVLDMLPSNWVNDPAVIKQNDKVVAINSAIEVDLTGQVCADSIGTKIFSGIGGQVDFERGAALSKGGKPIIALPSRTQKGLPRIVPFLKPGAGVVTSRAHVHWVITEYGKAYLFGKNIRQRVDALINIAHPEDRDALRAYAKANLHC
eukprot:TRINITY_DN4777_c0_g1_i1.p1 TRINITY_DN4777_c0_g1~~TRINITY_DN4777_c0_g1_i1.p1  ORF type:complete len:464 (-),score=104.94 TRINITY_DN4777_c0_g1_i1:96-1487(-)